MDRGYLRVFGGIYRKNSSVCPEEVALRQLNWRSWTYMKFLVYGALIMQNIGALRK